MRNIMDAKTIQAYAELVATTIVIRDENGDKRRETTDIERDYIYAVVKSALDTLNFNKNHDVQAIIDMAEFTIDALIDNCNGYLTVYNPIKSFVKNVWEVKEA